MIRRIAVGIVISLVFSLTTIVVGDEDHTGLNPAALIDQGFYQEALDAIEPKLEGGTLSSPTVGTYIGLASQCLQQLNQYPALDAFATKYHRQYRGNPYALVSLAKLFLHAPHYAQASQAGFERQKDWGRINLHRYDQVKALQLAMQAKTVALKNSRDTGLIEEIFHTLGDAYWANARLLTSGVLTDLDTPPTVGMQPSVNIDTSLSETTPSPVSFAAAKTDFERWRYLLMDAQQYPHLVAWAQVAWATYVAQRYDLNPDARHLTAVVYAQKNLTNNQVVSVGDNGTTHIQVLGKNNTYIDQLIKLSANRELADSLKVSVLDMLVNIMTLRNRRAETVTNLKKLLVLVDSSKAPKYQQRLNQYTQPLARFEKGTSSNTREILLRYRNTKTASYSLRTINSEQLLAVIKKIHRSKKRFSHRKLTQIIAAQSGALLSGPIKAWRQQLPQGAAYEDGQVPVMLPDLGAKPFWLEVTLDNGYQAQVLLWRSPTLLTSLEAENHTVFYLAESERGTPVKRSIEFLPADRGGKPGEKSFSCETNAQGFCVIPNKKLGDNNWLTYVQNANGAITLQNTQTYYFYQDDTFDELLESSALAIQTNQPIYRPGQTVKLKGWIRNPKFGKKRHRLHGKKIPLVIQSPSGEDVVKTKVRLGPLGQFSAEFTLTDNADLGSYDVIVAESLYETFLVEEFKKPEMDVFIDTKKSSQQLEGTLKFAVAGKYYFGEPVKNGRVSYRISAYSAYEPIYPDSPWDWYLNKGYAWIPETDLSRPFDEDDEFGNDDGFYQEFHGEVNFDPVTSLAYIELPLTTEELSLWPDPVEFDIDFTVKDRSRRIIEESTSLVLYKESHQVYTWLDKAFYQEGDTVTLSIEASTAANSPVAETGEAVFTQLHTEGEAPIKRWTLATGENGSAELTFKAPTAGLYRLSYTQKGSHGNPIKGERLIRVIGQRNSFYSRSNADLVFLAERAVYTPNDTARFFIHANVPENTPVIFIQQSGKTPNPQLFTTSQQGVIAEVTLKEQADNNEVFNAFYIHNGRVESSLIMVPVVPKNRFLNVALVPGAQSYAPGDKVTLDITVTDLNGIPKKSEVSLAVYDAALKPFAQAIPSRYFETALFIHSLYPSVEEEPSYSPASQFLPHPHASLYMYDIGPAAHNNYRWAGTAAAIRNRHFYSSNDDRYDSEGVVEEVMVEGIRASLQLAMDIQRDAVSVVDVSALSADDIGLFADTHRAESLQRVSGILFAPTPLKARSNFVDSVFWRHTIKTNRHGKARVSFTLPDNTTQWSLNAWAAAQGLHVGSASADIVVNKPLVLRMQTPRFMVEGDTLTVSANIANYSEQDLSLATVLTTDPRLSILQKAPASLNLARSQESRLDWEVEAHRAGAAQLTMSAQANTLTDGVQRTLPIFARGALIQKNHTGELTENQTEVTIALPVPSMRVADQSEVDIYVSPYLIAPALKSLPYLAGYAYGCSEQTLNKFLPSALAVKVFKQGQFNIQQFMTPEISIRGQADAPEAVWAADAIMARANAALTRLANMQNGDGGWGWFAGGDSYGHATALVMQGLSEARRHGLDVDEDMFAKGLHWLQHHPTGNDTDAEKILINYVLAINNLPSRGELNYFYEKRLQYSHYKNMLLALTYHARSDTTRRDQIVRHILQYAEQDADNVTAYLRPKDNRWGWHWYNSDIETQAQFARLLLTVQKDHELLPQVIQYLLNHQGYGSYWESTRATAAIVAVLLDYHQYQRRKDHTAELNVLLNGMPLAHTDFKNQPGYTHRITAEKLINGEHTLTLQQHGTGNLYYNVQARHYSKENDLQAAGLELTLKRRFFKINPYQQNNNTSSRTELYNNDAVASGDIIEVELHLKSNNDYEYLLIEDRKAAGFETINGKSGYMYGGLSAYVEYRDERVSFFVQRISRGKHILRYRLRAETPGHFTALPATIEALYAPELRGNSNAQRLHVSDNH